MAFATKKDSYHFTYHQYYVLYWITIVVTLPRNVTSIVSLKNKNEYFLLRGENEIPNIYFGLKFNIQF